MVSIKISSCIAFATLATLVQSSPVGATGVLAERDCPQCGYAGAVCSYHSISNIPYIANHFFSVALHATIFVLVGRRHAHGVAKYQVGSFNLIFVFSYARILIAKREGQPQIYSVPKLRYVFAEAGRCLAPQ